MVADRILAKAEKLATELGGKAKPMPVADAISKSDVVVLAIYFDAIKDLLATYRWALAGKVIVDPCAGFDGVICRTTRKSTTSAPQRALA